MADEVEKRKTNKNPTSSTVKKQRTFNWPCSYCGREFLKKNGLNDHINSQHKCRVCRELVLSHEQKTQHEQKHNEERIQKEKAKLAKKQAADDLMKSFVLPNKLEEYNGEFEEIDFE